jgi:hypothetical protein
MQWQPPLNDIHLAMTEDFDWQGFQIVLEASDEFQTLPHFPYRGM